MNTPPRTAALPATAEALEARLGATLAAGLSQKTATLPHDIAERLRAGRERALQRARVRHADLPVAVSSQGSATLGRAGGWVGGFWLRLATWAPLAVLVAGLVLIQEWNAREQVLAAAEIDAQLLADDLPPAAWTDPGFREYLRAPPP